MKILLRTLFVSLLQAFAFCVVACLLLPLVFDLFSSLNEFLQNTTQPHLILEYYEGFIPNMIPMVLPPALLFATIYTLLDFNRTSQLVAMQACGISISTIFIPFIALGVLCSLFLFILNIGWGGAPRAQQNGIMDQLRNPNGVPGIEHAQVYRNSAAHRTWYLQTISLPDNAASGIDVCEQDSIGRDVRQIFARNGAWNGKSWTFTDALVEVFDEQGNVATRQIYDHFTPDGWSESPKSMIHLSLRPEEMTLPVLRQAVAEAEDEVEAGSASSIDRRALYRTQIDEFLVYPLAALVFLLLALPQGLQHGRTHVGAGVFNALFLLIGFYIVWNFSLAMGRGARIPPWAAVGLPIFGFAAVALFRIGRLIGFQWIGQRLLSLKTE